MSFDAAQRIADAVLYEGYLLYPYHGASGKNRVRFQFGVVAPRDFSERDGSEAWEMQTECLLDAADEAALDIRVRFLQLQSRTVEAIHPSAADGFAPVAVLRVGDDEFVAWDEAVERQVDETNIVLADVVDGERDVPFVIDGGQDIEPVHGPDGALVGRIVRRRWPIDGRVHLAAERVDGLVRLRVRVENRTPLDDEVTTREVALRSSLLGCHTLLAVRAGGFVSLIDPPARAEAAARDCVNLRTWPVLVGEEGSDDLVLSSPIILYDHPAIAPESHGDLFDATEIDEILTLRIMTLSDEEKRAARATDPRARAIIDAADAMPPEMLDRLHGAIRYLRDSPAHAASPDELAWPTLVEPKDDADRLELPPSVWEPDARVRPELAAVEIGGTTISKGASVRLRPNRRADSMDFFLAGRIGTVEAVFESVDDDIHVAVTLDDDPATDLHRAYGRYFYFAPDELEPLAAAPGGPGPGPVILEPSARSLVDR
jgi:hypothetical protein